MTQENKKEWDLVWNKSYDFTTILFRVKEENDQGVREVTANVDCRNMGYIDDVLYAKKEEDETDNEFEQRILQETFDRYVSTTAIFKKAVQEQAFIIKDPNGWNPISQLDVTENYGVPYLLFSKELIDPDFNPSGVVDGFYQDGEGWVGGVWDNDQDCYNVVSINPTHYKEKRGPNV